MDPSDGAASKGTCRLSELIPFFIALRSNSFFCAFPPLKREVNTAEGMSV